MNKLNILCVAPYSGMYNILQNIASQKDDVNLIVKKGDLDESIKYLQDFTKPEVCAIISRGATAKRLRQKTDLPVYEIQPSLSMLIHTIGALKQSNTKFSIVCYPTIAASIKDFIVNNSPDIDFHSISSDNDRQEYLFSLKAKGITTIIGDSATVRTAENLGMNGLLILSDIAEIKQAVDFACDLEKRHLLFEKQTSLLQEIIKVEGKIIVIFSADSTICYSSVDVRKISTPLMELMLRHIPDVIAGMPISIHRRIGDLLYTLKGSRISNNGENYCVYNLAQMSPSKNRNKYAVKIYSKTSAPAEKPIEYYLGISRLINNLYASCERYADLSIPLIFEGARGTGKDCFAYYIYQHSRLRNNSFVVIDGKTIDDNSLGYLLRDDSSPLLDQNITVFFQRLNYVDKKYLQALIMFIKDSGLIRYNRCFFSFSKTGESLSGNELYLYLSETIHCPILSFPSLAQRREDIPYLINLFVNDINLKNGKHVAGLTPDAILELQNFQWERNVDQLYEYVQQLVMAADSDHVSYDRVHRLLQEYQYSVDRNDEDFVLNMNQPLDSIIYDLVYHIYQKENMNQTHTAKRLGISRSTLWRMLKKK